MSVQNSSEILIVGGGVIGLSIARELRRRGVRDILIVEKGQCGQEASWAAAGMLGVQADTDEGGTLFEMMRASGAMYPDFVAELSEETGVDIELDRTGTLNLAFTEADSAKLAARFAWQQSAGLAVEKMTAAEVLAAEPLASPNLREALFFPNDWQVDNRKLLAALRRYAELNDIRIIENEKVSSLAVDLGKSGSIITDKGEYFTDHVVLATGAWTSLIKIGGENTPGELSPVRGQIACYRFAERAVRHVLYSASGYLVPRRDGRLLAGSTSESAGFDKSVTEQNNVRLHRMASEIVPSLNEMPVADEWAGLRPKASDELPVLGGINGIDGLTIATGHYRNGILLTPLTADLIASKIVENRDSDYLFAFSPDRFNVISIGSASS